MRPARLRVLHLRTSDRFGGPERLILDQARLAAPDVSVVIASFATGDGRHPFLGPAREEGAEVVRVPQSGSYDPLVAKRVSSIVKQLCPAVLVGHDYKADLVLSLAGGSRPRVAMVHGYTAEDTKIRLFEAVDRQLLRSFAAVVVVADPLREQLASAGVAPDRIHVVQNGVDAERIAAAAQGSRAEVRREWGVADEDRVVLVLGRLSPEKGQDVALEAFAGLGRGEERNRIRLVLVGDGAAREALETRARRPDLAGRVHFAGWRDDPWRCLGAADVFLLPSRREGLPLALLEAMAVGLPIVATDVGAVREVIGGDERIGTVIASGDAEEMRAALAIGVRPPSPSSGTPTPIPTHTAARARVADTYGIERQVRALETIYKAV